MVQQPAAGQYGQVQGLFDRGRLVAVHTSVQRGPAWGAAPPRGWAWIIPRPGAHRRVGEALAVAGRAHARLPARGRPAAYIECNPRTVEPGNAAASGVNIPELQVRLTLGEELPPPPRRRPAGSGHTAPSPSCLEAPAEAARVDGARRDLCDAIARRGLYADSSEQLTPVLRDPPSLAPAAFVAARLLASPRQAAGIAGQAVNQLLDRTEDPGGGRTRRRDFQPRD